MSVERSGQAIGVETLKGQLVTGGARGFNEGRQLFIDGTSRMNREVQIRNSVRGSVLDSLGLLGASRLEPNAGAGSIGLRNTSGLDNASK